MVEGNCAGALLGRWRGAFLPCALCQEHRDRRAGDQGVACRKADVRHRPPWLVVDQQRGHYGPRCYNRHLWRAKYRQRNPKPYNQHQRNHLNHSVTHW